MERTKARRAATLRDVATASGVSPGTVSNYLNYPERVAKSTASRIQRAIDSLDYVANAAASTTRRGVSATLGNLLLESNNPAMYSYAEALEERARERGFSTLTASSSGRADRQDAYLDLFRQHRVAGIFVTPVGTIDDRVRTLQAQGISVVILGQKASAGLCSSVSVDDFVGGQLAVEHLVSLGRTRLMFVGDAPEIEPIAQRLGGAKDVARRSGATLATLPLRKRTIAEGRELALRMDWSGVDGVFAANDLVAIGLLHGLLERGIRIPDDIAVVGFDDIDFAADAIIPLTTVRRPASVLGEAAADILVREVNERLEGRIPSEFPTTTFAPSLIARATTASVTG